MCIDVIDWDIERFSDKMPGITNPNNYAEEKRSQQRNRTFPEVKIGKVEVPSCVVDGYGRVVLWHLPGILSLHRIVSIYVIETTHSLTIL